MKKNVRMLILRIRLLFVPKETKQAIHELFDALHEERILEIRFGRNWRKHRFGDKSYKVS